jgi:NAD(P)-dependent dehydrogenase (short-subunit alcohol dehydrogenase family)
MEKIAIITGANNGLGFELTKELAIRGYKIIMACRDQKRANNARNEILKITTIKPENLIVKILDLSKFSSIIKFTNDFITEGIPIELLVNNAGIMDVNFALTEDNNELVFQTNYLGHFILTLKLLPLITKKIVNVCSLAANFGNLDIDNLQQFDKDHYNKSLAYKNSKLANLMFSNELANRLKDKGSPIISVAAHPGYTKSGIVNNNSSGLGIFYAIGNSILAQTAKKGIIPILYACICDVKSGDYYGPSGCCELFGNSPKLIIKPANKQLKDKELSKSLWNKTCEITNIKF